MKIDIIKGNDIKEKGDVRVYKEQCLFSLRLITSNNGNIKFDNYGLGELRLNDVFIDSEYSKNFSHYYKWRYKTNES